MKVRLVLWASFILGLFSGVDYDQTNELPPLGTEVIPLWPGGAPDSLGYALADTPRLIAFFPKSVQALSPAVIICPGGAYTSLSMMTEGYNVAAWFQARGMAAFVLRYRLPGQGYGGLVPLQDAQRALRLVRYHALAWHLHPHKIGVMGFSAGGHLASSLEVHADNSEEESADQVEQESSRPDFALLIYPVINFQVLPHPHSRKNLLGVHPDPALIAYFSSDQYVTARTPPTCLVVADDDKIVSPQQSHLMYEALQKAGVPSVLQEYPKGGHGFGFGHLPPRGPKDWLLPVEGWLRGQNFWP